MLLLPCLILYLRHFYLFWQQHHQCQPYLFKTCRHYIHPPASLFAKPILLVPETQVQALLDEINSAFGISIQLPRDPFLLAFYRDGTPVPTRLGVSQSRESIGEMERQIPPPSEDHGDCPTDASPELERSFERFKEKMERAAAIQKKKNAAVKKGKAKDRLAKHVNWCEALRRGQRYLGLRPVDLKGGLPVPDPSLPWDEQQNFGTAQKIKHGPTLRPLDVERPAPHAFDRNVVFVSVDIEAFERNHNLITEVGISTLDTADIKSVAPGDNGVNWMECIRSRHFRISDHDHLRNTTFCIGDPERFLFGRSEFVRMKEIGNVVDSCFEPPYSAGFVYNGNSGAHDKASVSSIQSGNRSQSVSLESRSVPEPQPFDAPVDVQGPKNAQQGLANEVAVSNVLQAPEASFGAKVTTSCSQISSSRDTSKTDIQEVKDRALARQKPRNVILVGHNLDSDLQYLSTIKSKIFHKPPALIYPQPLQPEDPLRQHILESLDTANLYQVWKREANIASLANILVAVGRTGWGLHNGGNDARYTLEVMIGILLRSRIQEGEAIKPPSAGGMTGSEDEKYHAEDKLARKIREKQEAVARDERENAAMWTHAYGEGVEEVLPDPYNSQRGTAKEQSHHDELEKGSAADSHVQIQAQSHADHNANEDEPYPWSSCPRATRDGGEPRGFVMPTPKSDKTKSSSRRNEELSKLQEEGEIGGPCDWGIGGEDGW